MNISATTFGGYTYTNTKTNLSKKQNVNQENTFEKLTKKEYKSAIKEFKQRHPDEAAHVDKQVQYRCRSCCGSKWLRSLITSSGREKAFKKLWCRKCVQK